MNFIINDYDIYYEKYGNGQNTLLILPGWGDTRSTFKYIINYFKKYFTIYIIDYPGFGKSKFPNRDLTIDDYTNLIIDFMKVHNIKEPIIIAHSFGGRISINLVANKKVKINKLILIDAAGIKPKKTIKQLFRQTIYKLLKRIKYILPKKYRKKYLNYLINIFGSTDYKNLDQNIRKTFINIVNTDLKDYIKEINTDTLIIWGEKDIDTPLKDAYYMRKSIKDSGLIILKGAHHFSYLEAPSYVNTILHEFIKEDM